MTFSTKITKIGTNLKVFRQSVGWVAHPYHYIVSSSIILRAFDGARICQMEKVVTVWC